LACAVLLRTPLVKNLWKGVEKKCGKLWKQAAKKKKSSLIVNAHKKDL